jgi:hypothetical protein
MDRYRPQAAFNRADWLKLLRTYVSISVETESRKNYFVKRFNCVICAVSKCRYGIKENRLALF